MDRGRVQPLDLQQAVVEVPLDPSAGGADPHPELHSVVDSNGFPNSTYPLYHPDAAGRRPPAANYFADYAAGQPGRGGPWVRGRATKPRLVFAA